MSKTGLLSLLDFPREIQLKIYEHVFEPYDLVIRSTFHCFKGEDAWPESDKPLTRQPRGFFKIRYSDDPNENSILRVCKATRQIASKLRAKEYSGILRVMLYAPEDWDQPANHFEFVLTDGYDKLLAKTTTLSLTRMCDKEELVQAVKFLPALREIEICHKWTADNDDFNEISSRISERAGKPLKAHELRTCLIDAFERGELDEYYDSKIHERELGHQIALQFVLDEINAKGFGHVQILRNTAYQYEADRMSPAICLVKVDRYTDYETNFLFRYTRLPNDLDVECTYIGDWVECLGPIEASIGLTDSSGKEWIPAVS